MPKQELIDDNLPVIDIEDERGRAFVPGPNEEELKRVRAIATSLVLVNRDDRITQLRKSIYYVLLKQLYEDYAAVAYARGMSKRDILSYPEFKDEYGTQLDPPSTVSDLTRIADRYIFRYKMVKWRVVEREDEPGLDWYDPPAVLDAEGKPLLNPLTGEVIYESGIAPETSRIVIDEVEELLLLAPKRSLLRTRPYHNTVEQAREILRGAEGKSWLEYERWLKEQQTLEEQAQLHDSELVDDQPEAEPTTPYREIIKEVIPGWHVQQAGLHLDDLLAAHNIPTGNAAGDWTVTISIKGKLLLPPTPEDDDEDAVETVSAERILEITGRGPE